MRVHSRWVSAAWVLAFVLGATIPGSAQQERFSTGQSVQPFYDGWLRNADGSFDMVFGYLNRNYVEEPSVPIGPNNNFSPGPADRGQPTYFYPRTQRYQFHVRVPADFGKTQELVWTVTVNGKAEQAIGWLQPEWEIDRKTITSNSRVSRGRSNKELYGDRPPSITIDPVQPVPLPNLLRLVASVSDDGLPVDLPERKPPEPLPTLRGAREVPDNIVLYEQPTPPRNGLSVLWIVYRGPAKVAFESDGYKPVMEGDGKTSGKSVTTARFSRPGTYVLRAIASDALLSATADVTVSVTAPGTPSEER